MLPDYSHGVGKINTYFLHQDGHVIDVFLQSTAIDKDDRSAGVIFTAIQSRLHQLEKGVTND